MLKEREKERQRQTDREERQREVGERERALEAVSNDLLLLLFCCYCLGEGGAQNQHRKKTQTFPVMMTVMPRVIHCI